MNKWLYCSHVWMAPGKISCKLTGSSFLNKVFELNGIELNAAEMYKQVLMRFFRRLAV